MNAIQRCERVRDWFLRLSPEENRADFYRPRIDALNKLMDVHRTAKPVLAALIGIVRLHKLCQCTPGSTCYLCQVTGPAGVAITNAEKEEKGVEVVKKTASETNATILDFSPEEGTLTVEPDEWTSGSWPVKGGRCRLTQ